MSSYHIQPKRPEQTPEEKERLRKAAEALFVDLDAEFGKKPKGLAKVKTAAPKPAPLTEGQEANRINQLLSASSPWSPVGRVAHLIVQTCKCCKGEREYIGNTLIRHQHKTRGYLWDCSMPPMREHSHLPQSVQEVRQFIDECPDCFRLGMHVQELTPTASSKQLKLFE